jgi:hypothetical protein
VFDNESCKKAIELGGDINIDIKLTPVIIFA